MTASDLVAMHLECLRGDESALRSFPQACRDLLEELHNSGEEPSGRSSKYSEAWQLCVDLSGFVVEAGVVEQ